jgi:carbamoyltransferase
MEDGRLVAAAQEERFTRVKHDPEIPRLAFRYCLEQSGKTISEIDCVAYYEDPVKKLDRQLWAGLPQLPTTSPLSLFCLDAMRPARDIREVLGFDGEILFVDHHKAHAASSYYFSGFPDAALLTVDAVGEWATTSYGRAEGKGFELFEEVCFPDSIGLLYSAITAYLGFDVNDAEYKVMGLAPYGEPRYVEEMYSLIKVGEGGQFRLQLEYFDLLGGETMYSEKLCTLLGKPPRVPEAELLQFHKDVARSLQTVLEEVLLTKVRYLHTMVNSENLCMAGGVALNCTANARILRDGPFKRLFVQPASSDAGGCLGAAAIAHVQLTGERPETEPMRHLYLGPSFDNDEIAAIFAPGRAKVLDFRGQEDELLRATVERLAAGKVVGWFQGKMEFGPRALGGRSILADPRAPQMRDRINALVKKRESFRPFAPAVLASRVGEHFELDHLSPFMLETCRVKSALDLPSITHVDGSARVQTVEAESSPRFHCLLQEFERRTGCPILLNTSFNLRGEPIVCTPLDALLCFIRSGLDCLIMEDFLLDRTALPESWISWFGNTSPRSGAAISQSVYTLL